MLLLLRFKSCNLYIHVQSDLMCAECLVHLWRVELPRQGKLLVKVVSDKCNFCICIIKITVIFES
jgi:hypothetical protein